MTLSSALSQEEAPHTNICGPQLQEKCLAMNKQLYLEKAFDSVPWKINWWALRKLCVE